MHALKCCPMMLYVYIIKYIIKYHLYLHISTVHAPTSMSGTALRAVPILERAAVLVGVHLHRKMGHTVATRFLLVSCDSIRLCRTLKCTWSCKRCSSPRSNQSPTGAQMSISRSLITCHDLKSAWIVWQDRRSTLQEHLTINLCKLRQNIA